MLGEGGHCQCFFFTRENFQNSAREVFKLAEKNSWKLPEKKKCAREKNSKIVPEKKINLPQKTQKVPEKKSVPKKLVWIFLSYLCDWGGFMSWWCFLNLSNAIVKTVLCYFGIFFCARLRWAAVFMIFSKLSFCMHCNSCATPWLLIWEKLVSK